MLAVPIGGDAAFAFADIALLGVVARRSRLGRSFVWRHDTRNWNPKQDSDRFFKLLIRWRQSSRALVTFENCFFGLLPSLRHVEGHFRQHLRSYDFWRRIVRRPLLPIRELESKWIERSGIRVFDAVLVEFRFGAVLLRAIRWGRFRVILLHSQVIGDSNASHHFATPRPARQARIRSCSASASYRLAASAATPPSQRDFSRNSMHAASFGNASVNWKRLISSFIYTKNTPKSGCVK